MAAAVKDAETILTPEMEREAFSSVFPGVVPASRPLDDRGQPVGDPSPRGNVSEAHIKYLTRVQGMEYRLRAQGVSPATILNMNPYQLKINSTLMGDIVVPPCQPGEPYSVTVIRDHRVSREEGTEGDAMPVPWVPIILAREFSDTYYANGGVVVYTGDGMKEPPAVDKACTPLPELEKKDPALARNIREAKARQLVWAREKVREATNEWNTPNRSGARNINDIHRACANLVHDLTGQEMPAWLEKVPGQFGLGEQCPQCKAVPQSGAVMCPNCAFVLDPKAAFEMGTIGIEDMALTRLDRLTLEEMGVSELIEETVSERNEKFKKMAEAKRKENKGLAAKAQAK